MKKYIETIKKSILWWIVFWISMLWVVYAANISSVTQTINTWDTISKDWYNDVNNKLNNWLWIWVWQTRQSVTRNIGVTYTNTTGKPIVLRWKARRNAVSTAGLGINIDGISMLLCYNTNSGWGNTSVGEIIIPNWSEYTLSVSSEPLSGYVIHELR